MTEETTTQALATVPSAEITAKQSGRVPGDVLNKNTAHLEDEERSAIRWLYDYAVNRNLSLSETGALIRYDASVVSKIYNGRYEVKLDGVVQAIANFRKVLEERSTVVKMPFIETSLAHRIWELCRMASRWQRIGLLFGESQIGKTAALEQFAKDNNHGSTVYVSMPTGGSRSLFLAALAKKLHISPQQQQCVLIQRIIDAFDERMLLIVDELHRAVKREASIETIEFIRELYDAKKCGVVMCGTLVFEDALREGPFAKVLIQTKRRRVGPLKLPSVSPDRDLNLFAKQFGLLPATGEARTLQSEVNKEEGLGMWLTYLGMANEIARKKGRKLEWVHVIKAHAAMEKLKNAQLKEEE
jgi:DNA transposition AAA+ family ATPase